MNDRVLLPIKAASDISVSVGPTVGYDRLRVLYDKMVAMATGVRET